MFKKYKLWWLIVTGVSLFTLFNWTTYGLFGLSLIATKNFDQGVVQMIVGIISSLVSLVANVEGYNLKEQNDK